MGIAVGKCEDPEFEYSFKQLITERERALVFHTWNEVSSTKHEIGKEFVLGIIVSSEALKKWFKLDECREEDLSENAKLLSHARVFGNFINTVVNNIGEDFIVPYMQQVGAKHYYLLGPNVEDSLWRHFADGMIDVVVANVCKKQQQKVRLVWNKIFRILSHHVKRGYTEAHLADLVQRKANDTCQAQEKIRHNTL